MLQELMGFIESNFFCTVNISFSDFYLHFRERKVFSRPFLDSFVLFAFESAFNLVPSASFPYKRKGQKNFKNCSGEVVDQFLIDTNELLCLILEYVRG